MKFTGVSLSIWLLLVVLLSGSLRVSSLEDKNEDNLEDKGENEDVSRQISAAPSISSAAEVDVHRPTLSPTAAAIFGDDNPVNLHDPNKTTYVQFIDEEEDPPQDAVALALYMLASVIAFLTLCMAFSYCKSKLFTSSLGTYTPVYTDSMDDTTHGSAEMIPTSV